MSAAVGAPWARGDLICHEMHVFAQVMTCTHPCMTQGRGCSGEGLFWGVLRSHMG